MSAVVSIVLTALTLLLAGSSRALAQASDPPAFITEDLEKDGPGVNGIPTCDDPPLRTDGDVSASQATCDTCPGGQSPVEIADTYNDTADPVLLHNGAVSYRATDLVIPGRGLHFELTRRYNSKRAQEDGVMGFGWEFAYDQRIDFDADPSWEARVTGRLQNGNNRVDTYVKAASSSDFFGSSGVYTRIAQLPGSPTVWVLRARHGSKSYFEYAPLPSRTYSYRLFMIEDASGNHLVLDYFTAAESVPFEGRLQKITDTLGREITFHYVSPAAGLVRLEKVIDFAGREVRYGYDVNGDLISARSPTVTSTGLNDFPSGRTEQYTYTGPLDHLLHKVIRPREVAGGLTTAYVTFSYFSEASWKNGWVQSQVLGSGTIQYQYSTQLSLPTGYTDLGPASIVTYVADRRSNVTQYWFDASAHLVLKGEFVEGGAILRTKFRYNAEGEITEVTRPRGNIETRTYHPATTRFQAGNLASITHSRGFAPDLEPNYDSITTTYEWDPVFNHLLARADPRNATWRTEFVLDYMEGSATAGAPNDVAPAIAVLLGITETESRDLLALFVRNADLNGDGVGGVAGTVPVRGHVIQRIAPSVSLAQAPFGVDHQSSVEGDATQQAITSWTYNAFGQVTSQTDAEENVTLFGYTPWDDVNSDGLSDAGGGSAVGTTGGLPRRTIEDTALPYAGDFSAQFAWLVPRALATDIGRNKATLPSPAPIDRTTDLIYDARRHLVAYVDGRGVRQELSVNELGEVWKVSRGVDTSATAARQGGSPDEPNEGHIAGTSFGYSRVLLRDANGLVISTHDTNSVGPTGSTWDVVYEYDILDNLRFERVEENTTGGFVSTETRYDANENVVEVHSPLQNITRFTYDARDQLADTYRSGLSALEERVETLGYDANGNVTSRVDGNWNTTAYVHDEFDRQHNVTDAIGNERVTSYDQASNLVKSIDKMKPAGAGAATPLRSNSVRYDERSRPWRIDHSPEDGSTVVDGALLLDGLVSARFDHDRLSRLTFRTEDDAKVYESHFDGLSRRVWTKDPAGNVRKGSFDDEDNLVGVTEVDTYPGGAQPREFWTWRRYDALGRLVSHTNQLGETERHSYDARDLVVASSDAEASGTAGQVHGVNVNPPGNSRSFVYDGRGLLTSETIDLSVGGQGSGSIDTSNPANPDGQVVLVQEWDADGRLWKRSDDNGNTTEYLLDHRGRVLEERFANGTANIHAFDANGNMLSRFDARQILSEYQYDALDRLKQLALVTNPSTALGTILVAFGYDGIGRRTEAFALYRTQSDTQGSTLAWSVTRQFDAFDRLTRETQNGRELLSAWREESKRSSISYPSMPAFTVDFVYDSLDRVSKIKSNNVDAASYTYAGPDRKLARSLRNRSSTRWHDGSFNDADYYDGAKRQTKLEHVNILTQAQLGSFEHAYNRAGARRWERRAHDGGKGDNYGHDSLYRLTKFERRVPFADVGTLGLGNDESDREWTLDGVHNWSGFKIDGTPRAGVVNSVHNYTNFGGVVPTYDQVGNLTKPDGAGTVVLDYDFLNRLVCVRDTAAGTALEHVYDAEGRRVQTIFNGVAGAPLAREYVHDGWEVLEEHDKVTNPDPNGQPTWRFMRRYVMGVEIDEPISMEVLPGQVGTRTLHYMQSTLGNVVGLTDNTGSVVERYTYDAYGAPRFEDANNVPRANQKSAYGNPYLFTGRRYEPWILSLYEYRNRFYLPEQGRFLQRDPIGAWGDKLNLGNPLAYVGSVPFCRRDPLGLDGGATAAVIIGGATVGQGLAAVGVGVVAVVTSPVALGVLAVAGIGIGGYFIYKLITDTGTGGTGPGYGGGAGAVPIPGTGAPAVPIPIPPGPVVEVGKDVTGRPVSIPREGEPGSTVHRPGKGGAGTGTYRRYGPDGLPEWDWDCGHTSGPRWHRLPHDHRFPGGEREKSGPGRTTPLWLNQ